MAAKGALILSFLTMSLKAAPSPDRALDRARALRPPPVVEKLGGELEGADFWDQNQALLHAAWGELGQLHPYVYAPSPEQALVPAAARALHSLDPVEALLALTKETEVLPSPPPPSRSIFSTAASARACCSRSLGRHTFSGCRVGVHP